MEPSEIFYEGTHWVTVAEAAVRFNVQPQTIRRYLKLYYWVKTRYFPREAGGTLYLDYHELVRAQSRYKPPLS